MHFAIISLEEDSGGSREGMNGLRGTKDMKEISILGVSIKERSLKESLALTDSFLKNGALNTILYVSAKMLQAADKNPELKDWIESMDMTLCTEPDILRAANAATANRIREVENNAYLKETIRRLSKGRQSIYLLAEKETDLERLKSRLRQNGPVLNIVAENSMEAVDDDMARIVNHMNDVAANVIISMIPFPKQERVIVENRNYINSEIWLALPMPEEAYVPKERERFFNRTLKRLYFSKFKKQVIHYKEEIETE